MIKFVQNLATRETKTFSGYMNTKEFVKWVLAVLCGLFIWGIVKSDQSDLSALDGCERVAFLSLFSDLEFRHVHQQDTLLGNNGAGASGE